MRCLYAFAIATALLALACAPNVRAEKEDQETVFWESIRESKSADDFKAYLDQFPNGTFAGLARARMKSLAPSQPSSQANIGAVNLLDRAVAVAKSLGYSVAANDPVIGQMVITKELADFSTAAHCALENYFAWRATTANLTVTIVNGRVSIQPEIVMIRHFQSVERRGSCESTGQLEDEFLKALGK